MLPSLSFSHIALSFQFSLVFYISGFWRPLLFITHFTSFFVSIFLFSHASNGRSLKKSWWWRDSNPQASEFIQVHKPTGPRRPASILFSWVIRLIVVPRACKHAHTLLKGEEKKVQWGRKSTKGKGGLYKKTNSYSPSKVDKEWRNIPFFNLSDPSIGTFLPWFKVKTAHFLNRNILSILWNGICYFFLCVLFITFSY